ncbi:MAG: CopG family ribbon-helix-helix protein [Candidatus Binataceae bacterium]
MSELLTIRMDDETKTRLEKLAKTMDRTQSDVAVEAIRAYLALSAWQIEELGRALNEADENNFATEEEVKAVVGKWRDGER